MILEYDNLDDRLEIHRMMDVIKPVWRWRFLDWLCSHTLTTGGQGVAMTFTPEDYRQLVNAHGGIASANVFVTNTCYWQALLLIEQFKLVPKFALDVLRLLTKGDRDALHVLKRTTLANYTKHRIQLTPPGKTIDPANDRRLWEALE